MRSAFEREPVVELAKRLLDTGDYQSADEVAMIALGKHFGLSAGDGIWGESYAAECMGFHGHCEHVNLLDLIAGEVAKELRAAPSVARSARH